MLLFFLIAFAFPAFADRAPLCYLDGGEGDYLLSVAAEGGEEPIAAAPTLSALAASLPEEATLCFRGVEGDEMSLSGRYLLCGSLSLRGALTVEGGRVELASLLLSSDAVGLRVKGGEAVMTGGAIRNNTANAEGGGIRVWHGTVTDRKSTRLNSSHLSTSRMPSSA